MSIRERTVEIRAGAEIAFGALVETYGIKYHKAFECRTENYTAKLACHDFLAHHWKLLNTNTFIERVFVETAEKSYHRSTDTTGCPN